MGTRTWSKIWNLLIAAAGGGKDSWEGGRDGSSLKTQRCKTETEWLNRDSLTREVY